MARQLSWRMATLPHRVEVRVGNADYDEIVSWIVEYLKSDYQQSWGGDHPEAVHTFLFRDPNDAMLCKLTWGGR
jgi:hypothetical protein